MAFLRGESYDGAYLHYKGELLMDYCMMCVM